MEENQNKSHFWLNLFAVTSFSFLGFSFLTKFIGGEPDFPFFTIGLVCLGLTFISLLNEWHNKTLQKRKSTQKPSPFSQNDN